MWQIVGFPLTLVVTDNFSIQSSVQKGQKWGVQGAEDVDLTVGEKFTSFSLLRALSRAGTFLYLKQS